MVTTNEMALAHQKNSDRSMLDTLSGGDDFKLLIKALCDSMFRILCGSLFQTLAAWTKNESFVARLVERGWIQDPQLTQASTCRCHPP